MKLEQVLWRFVKERKSNDDERFKGNTRRSNEECGERESIIGLMKEQAPQHETRVINGREYKVIDLDASETAAEDLAKVVEQGREYEDKLAKLRQSKKLGATTLSYRRHAMADMQYHGTHDTNDYTHED